MIEIVCWNIQWGRGSDGVVNLQRIVDTAFARGAPDVLCLQEVARNFPDLDGGEGADQVALLAALLPGYETVYGVATDLAGDQRAQRKQFGNLVLSRLPVLQSFRHLLPRPPGASGPHAQKGAVEVVVAAASAHLRIVDTHLEYRHATHRAVQVERLRELHREACGHPAVHASLVDRNDEPTVPPVGPCPSVLCGDFNMNPEDAAYQRLLESFEDGSPGFADAWRVVSPDAAHPATCGVHERIFWDAPNCRDFFFVTGDVAGVLERLEVDGETDASDHQPMRLVIGL